jgi:hypothetical protein
MTTVIQNQHNCISRSYSNVAFRHLFSIGDMWNMAGPRVFGARLACAMAFALLLVGVQSASASPSNPGAPLGVRFADSDGDGISDEIDPDDDNDGISDIDEVAGPPPGPDPTIAPELPDADGDGIPNDLDPDDDNNGVPDDQAGNDPDPAADADGDGISDALDPDDDNDGITDEDEVPAPAPPAGGGQQPPGSNEDPAPAPSSEGALISGLPVTGSGTELASSETGFAPVLLMAALAGLILVLMRHRQFPTSGAGPRAG